jgi:hypothetical protein
MAMTRLLILAAGLEAATGFALMIDPPLVARLLLGDGVSGTPMALGRVAGIGLLSLGLACWPGANATSAPAMRALLTYNILITIYLLCLGIGGEWVGFLLWPAVILHGIVTLLLVSAWSKERQARDY